MKLVYIQMHVIAAPFMLLAGLAMDVPFFMVWGAVSWPLAMRMWQRDYNFEGGSFAHQG